MAQGGNHPASLGIENADFSVHIARILHEIEAKSAGEVIDLLEIDIEAHAHRR